MQIQSYLLSIVREFLSRIVSSRPNKHFPIPYRSQYARTYYTQDYIDNYNKRQIDARWPTTGAKSGKEYALWSNNICGMACLAMILDYFNIKHPPLVTMGKDCVTYGGYKVNKDTIDGLFYYQFSKYVQNEFNLKCSIAPFLSIYRIVYETARDHIVIASVSPEIKYTSKKIQDGGHLVVITGYDSDKKTLTIHNPSGVFKKTQNHHEISWKTFKKFFAGRGIILSK